MKFKDEQHPVRRGILLFALALVAIQGLTPDPGDMSSPMLVRIVFSGDVFRVCPLHSPLSQPKEDTPDEVCLAPRASASEFDVRLTSTRVVEAGIARSAPGNAPAPGHLTPLLFARQARFRATLNDLCRLIC